MDLKKPIPLPRRKNISDTAQNLEVVAKLVENEICPRIAPVPLPRKGPKEPQQTVTGSGVPYLDVDQGVEDSFENVHSSESKEQFTSKCTNAPDKLVFNNGDDQGQADNLALTKLVAISNSVTTSECNNALCDKSADINLENSPQFSECEEKEPNTIVSSYEYHQIIREKNIIKEIVTTEITYVYNLQRVVEDYQPYLYKHAPEQLKKYIPNIFGNISEIYKVSQKFLTSLQKNENGISGVMNLFVHSSENFNLHIEYSRTRLDADNCLQQFDNLIKQRERELHDYTGLVTHLSSPLRRLSKYVLMLANIKKKLKLSEECLENVRLTQTAIENVLTKCNDFIAINTIKNCGLDLSKQGSFMMRAPFNILHPRKFPSMVFLFENIIVFTERTKHENEFHYVDSIQMNHLIIRNNEDKSLTFFLTDFHRLKKFNDNFATYLLETEKEKIKKEWVSTIETKLWEQLHKAKENRKLRKDIPFEDTSSPTGSLKRPTKVTPNSVFYVDDTDGNTSFV